MQSCAAGSRRAQAQRSPIVQEPGVSLLGCGRCGAAGGIRLLAGLAGPACLFTAPSPGLPGARPKPCGILLPGLMPQRARGRDASVPTITGLAVSRDDPAPPQPVSSSVRGTGGLPSAMCRTATVAPRRGTPPVRSEAQDFGCPGWATLPNAVGRRRRESQTARLNYRFQSLAENFVGTQDHSFPSHPV